MAKIELCNCEQSLELQRTIDIIYYLLTSEQEHKVSTSILCLENKVSKKVKKTLAS